HIAALERETGLALFERAGRRRIPTEAAHVLAARAREAVAALREAEVAAQEIRGLRQGQLRVGASSTPGTYIVPRILGAFKQQHPGVDVQLDIADTREIEDRLRTREVDVGVVGQYQASPDLALAPLGPDLLVGICAPAWPGPRERTRLRAFLEQPFIARKRGSSTREVLETWLRARGWELRPSMEFSSTEAVKQAVAAGLGVSVVSAATITLELEAGLVDRPNLPGLPILRRFDVALLRRRRPPPAAAAFLGLLMGAEGAAALVDDAGR
ncbi:MAG: LysR substrate-binding domain-containing protein, partial [Actinomycetota bacterium]